MKLICSAMLALLFPVLMSGQTPMRVVDPNSGVSTTVWGNDGSIRVKLPPEQLFVESFDATNGFDITKFKTPASGGGGVAALTEQADTKLGTGTTANGFSYLESKMSFPVVNPSWLEVFYSINVPFPYVSNTYFFWGVGTSPTTPTAAAPLTEAAGFEIFTDGKLYAVMYQGGARQQIGDISLVTGACNPNACQPADSAAHVYVMWYRGDRTFWGIMNVTTGAIIEVAHTTSGAPGPNVNSLPLKVTAIANTVAPLSNAQVVVNAMAVGDTAHNGSFIDDPIYPTQKASVSAAGALSVQSPQPRIVQSKSASSTGSVASLTAVFAANTTAGNSIVVVAGVGNNTSPTATDTCGNTFTKAVTGANSTTFAATILYAVNIGSCTDTVTVSNGGAATSIAVEIYEVSGLIALTPHVLDQTSTASATSTAISVGPASPGGSNEFSFAGFAVGTAAQTVTVTTPYTNDSGQLNPTTPAGLFSFVSASSYLPTQGPTTAAATIVSEPWAAAVATFRTITVPMTGTMVIAPTAASANAIAATVNAAAGSSLILKATPGNLYDAYVNSTAAGLLMIFDATTAPVDGAVTPKHCIPVAANGVGSITFNTGPPESYATGIVLVMSTGTNCFNKAASATGFFHGRFQ